MTRYSLLLLLTAVPALLSCGSSPTATRDHANITVYAIDPHTPDPASELLDKRIDVELESYSLASAIDQVARATGVNIAPNWAAMMMVGVEASPPLSFRVRVKDTPAREVLDLIVEQANAITGEPDSIAWQYQDGVVVISTVEKLKRQTVFASYNVRSLIAPPPWPSALDPDAARADGEDVACGEDALHQIIGMIYETVGTINDWGERNDTVHEFNGYLIIKTTPKNHRVIWALLSVLPPPECRRCGKNVGSRASGYNS